MDGLVAAGTPVGFAGADLVRHLDPRRVLVSCCVVRKLVDSVLGGRGRATQKIGRLARGYVARAGKRRVLPGRLADYGGVVGEERHFDRGIRTRFAQSGQDHRGSGNGSGAPAVAPDSDDVAGIYSRRVAACSE